MRIAIINRHPDDFFGGSEMQCDNIARGLSMRGHDVAYIAPAGKTGHDYGRYYTVVPVASNANAIAAATIAFAPDIVYWRFNKYFFYKSVRKISARKIPVIFALSHISDTQPWSSRENPFTGVIPFLRYMKQGMENLFNHLGIFYVDGVTTNNPDFLNILPVKEQRFIANSVDATAIPFTWPRPFVIWVANIKPHKKPEKYIELARECADKGVDFLMVGQIQSDDFNWIKTENSRLPNFHYLGQKTLEEVNGILAQSLFLIHTCKPEGFGNNFIQAWLQEKATISLSFDPGGYITKLNLGGYARNNWPSFVERVKELLDNAQKRDECGRNALAFAKKTFSLDRTAEEVADFAAKILAQRSKN